LLRVACPLLLLAGGTDIISCFMGQNSSIPVYKGEIQARNLGMAVEAWDEEGEWLPDPSGM
jgi:acetoacetyl-CoA synthetase